MTNSNPISPISPKVLSIQSKLLSLKNEIKALINNSRYEHEKQAISCIKANQNIFTAMLSKFHLFCASKIKKAGVPNIVGFSRIL